MELSKLNYCAHYIGTSILKFSAGIIYVGLFSAAFPIKNPTTTKNRFFRVNGTICLSAHKRRSFHWISIECISIECDNAKNNYCQNQYKSLCDAFLICSHKFASFVPTAAFEYTLATDQTTSGEKMV